jgi:hypothetical protein
MAAVVKSGLEVRIEMVPLSIDVLPVAPTKAGSRVAELAA